MFSLSSSHIYHLYKPGCDMRKSFDGLCGLVSSELGGSPTSGEVFIFLNKSGTRIKLLHWENGGFVLYYKTLECGTFRRPSKDGNVISWSELVLMVEGIHVVRSITKKRYSLM